MGSGSKKTRQTYTPAEYIQRGSRTAAGLAQDYATRPYEAYTGQRIAPLSRGEQMASAAAISGAGTGREDVAAARGALGRMTDFTEADIQAYMNPYIQGALEPAARELREDIARREQDVRGRMTSAGAFGSRAALDVSEAARSGQEALSDLYGTGYAQAFQSAADMWRADQDRAVTQADAYLRTAGMGSDLLDRDISRLLETGENERRIQQGMADFDYQQFIEGRDWTGKQAGYLTDVLRGLKGSYQETTQTKEKGGGNVLGQVLGLGATIAGAYFGGPAGAAFGASLFRPQGSGGATSGGGAMGALTEGLGDAVWQESALGG